jgi:8-oxo-dGTP diphosphatase
VLLARATPADVDAFIALLEAAASRLTARGIAQWRPGSFAAARTAIEHAQAAGELRVARIDGRLAAGLIVSARPDPIWSGLGHARAVYLHRLVAATGFAGSGIGARVLAEVEREAREAGLEYARLDCVADNVKLARWYQSLGYFPRGTVDTAHGRLLRHDKRIAPLSGDLAVPSLDAVDFARWRTNDVATLCFVQDGERVLLIHKKRGHGAGKVNAPGGKTEPGESPAACARRETREEVGVDARRLECRAELRFQESTGYAMRGFAFVCTDFSGAPVETAEAAPFWCDVAALPLEAMWEDDRIWLPRILEGERLVGEFLFHHDRLVAHRLAAASAATLVARGEAVWP